MFILKMEYLTERQYRMVRQYMSHPRVEMTVTGTLDLYDVTVSTPDAYILTDMLGDIQCSAERRESL